MASRSSVVTAAEGDEFWDFAARGLEAGVEDGTGLGAVAGGVAAAGGALAAGVGADVVALGALAAAGAGFAAAFPTVAAGRATVLRTGADFLVTGVVLTSWPDGSTVFLTTGFPGATGTAGNGSERGRGIGAAVLYGVFESAMARQPCLRHSVAE